MSASLVTIPPDGFWTVDPLTTDVGARIAAANNPGGVKTDGALLVVQGDADIVVVPARTQAFYDKVCAAGQTVELVIVAGGNHDLKSDEARTRIAEWLQDRLGDEPATSTC